MVTENISGRGGQLPSLLTPGYAPECHHSVYDIFSAGLPVNNDYVNTNMKSYHIHTVTALSQSPVRYIGLTSTKVQAKTINCIYHVI